MNITFENPDKVNGLLTITVEEADYKDNVEKRLKDLRKKANVPGFRPGMVPMGLIRRQYGTSAKMEEINKLLGEQLYKYVQDNKIQMLGEPQASEAQEPVELEKEPPYTFKFDIAVAPEFKIELSGHDKVPYYEIEIDDALIDRQVDMFASQQGKYVDVDNYTDGDSVKGELRELDDNGNTKEGGIVVSDALIYPTYIKEEDQKKAFDGAKVGDVITFCPRKAYPDNDSQMAALLKIERDQVGEHTGNFSYQITNINHFEKHPVDQELFDAVYGAGSCKDENDFRAKIVEGLKAQLTGDSDYKFFQDLRAHCEKKVGKLAFPDALLKRMMLANNKDKGEEFVEKNYGGSIKELEWQLIKEQLAASRGVKVDDEDVKRAAKEAARAQFAQYGMNNVPEQYIENYADEMLKKRENVQPLIDSALDRKLTETFKSVVKLDTKKVTLDEFNKLMEAK